jgi:hypothetical protein
LIQPAKGTTEEIAQGTEFLEADAPRKEELKNIAIVRDAASLKQVVFVPDFESDSAKPV